MGDKIYSLEILLILCPYFAVRFDILGSRVLEPVLCIFCFPAELYPLLLLSLAPRSGGRQDHARCSV